MHVHHHERELVGEPADRDPGTAAEDEIRGEQAARARWLPADAPRTSHLRHVGANDSQGGVPLGFVYWRDAFGAGSSVRDALLEGGRR